MERDSLVAGHEMENRRPEKNFEYIHIYREIKNNLKIFQKRG